MVAAHSFAHRTVLCGVTINIAPMGVSVDGLLWWLGTALDVHWEMTRVDVAAMLATLVGLAAVHFVVLRGVVFRGRHDDSRDWYLLHAAANAVVVALAWPDLLATLSQPPLAFDGMPCAPAHAVVVALHVYHALAFPLTSEDLWHHGVSVFFVGTLAYMYHWGKLINAVDFFMCGLPGGIDYALLAAVKLGVCSKRTEKRCGRQGAHRETAMDVLTQSSLACTEPTCGSTFSSAGREWWSFSTQPFLAKSWRTATLRSPVC
jgi:hypothetical protein